MRVFMPPRRPLNVRLLERVFFTYTQGTCTLFNPGLLVRIFLYFVLFIYLCIFFVCRAWERSSRIETLVRNKRHNACLRRDFLYFLYIFYFIHDSQERGFLCDLFVYFFGGTSRVQRVKFLTCSWGSRTRSQCWSKLLLCLIYLHESNVYYWNNGFDTYFLYTVRKFLWATCQNYFAYVWLKKVLNWKPLHDSIYNFIL